MKKLLILGILLYVSLQVGAKAAYYYYNGARVPIVVSDDSIRMYFFDKTEANHEGNKEFVFSSQIMPLQRNNKEESIDFSSQEYIVLGDSGRTVQMSNHFYVQLFDSSDYQLLQQVADNSKVYIVGPVPHTRNWYDLIVNDSKINNSLEMSNYFYETGIFKNIDPGFIFHYKSSCVSDTHYSDQWGLPSIHACDAWNISIGDSAIKIAIIDQGIYMQHIEFTNTHFVNYYDCYWNDTMPHNAYTYHGTFVAGIIAASHNNAQIAGIAPLCKIMPINHPLTLSNYTSAQLASGIAWASSHGADVINCSWGDHNGQFYAYLHSALLESSISDALDYGREGKGCIVIFAAGNCASTQLDYPAYVYPSILTVGAIDTTYHRASYSSYGNNLDIVAPGSNIYSTTLSNGYNYKSGTSFAAPHVAAVAGLILSVNPDLTREEVVDIIESTAQKIEGYAYNTFSTRPNGVWNTEVGYGLVDAHAAVIAARGDNGIQELSVVCDTTKYYLRYAPPSGSSFAWSLSNANNPAIGSYSIIGPTNQDTVWVKRTYNLVPWPEGLNPLLDTPSLRGPSPTLTVTITTADNQSHTISKWLEAPTDNYPYCTIDSTSDWHVGYSRTLTVTNCLDEPDSTFLWVVKRRFSNTTTTYRGRTFTYTPVSFGKYTISVTNTHSECGYATSNYIFDVDFYMSLNATLINDQLNITIVKEGDDSQIRGSSNQKDTNYTLELWHTIYGRIHTQTMQGNNAQISTNGLLHGTYVVVLKENGDVVAQTKVQI